MSKKISFGVVGFLLLATPLISFAQTSVSVQTKIDALLKQITQLQAQIAALRGQSATTPATSGSSCATFARDFSSGATDATTNGDVSKLQQFLISAGVYPEALITGYFGPATSRALQRWQTANGVAITITGVGSFGPRTRAAILAKCGSAIPNQLMVQVIAYPISGSSPLTVTFQFKNLEEGGNYMLDTGDEAGSQFHIKNGTPCFSTASASICDRPITHIFTAGAGPNGGNTFKVRLFKYDEAKRSYAIEVAIGNIVVSVANSSNQFSCNTSPDWVRSVPLTVLCGAFSLSVDSRYSIDFGDGSTSGTLTLEVPARAFGPDGPNNKTAKTEHIYTSPGTYTISLSKDSARVATASVTAVAQSMVTVYPDGKPSPSISVPSEYAQYVSIKTLPATHTESSDYGFIGPVFTGNSTWDKYTKGGYGCTSQRFYKMHAGQKILVEFSGCGDRAYIPQDAMFRILDSLVAG